MKHALRITLGLMLLLSGAALHAQDEEEAVVVDARPQDLGAGLSIGGFEYQGDIDIGNAFSNGTHQFRLGLNLLGKYKIAYIGDFSTLHLIGRAGVHPIKASSDYLNSSVSTPYRFTNTIATVSAGFEWEFFIESSLRPNIAIGVGLLKHSPKIIFDLPAGTPRPPEMQKIIEYSATLPVSLGLSYTITPEIDLIFTLEKTLTFTDQLDGWTGGVNDGYLGVTVGAMYYFQ